ncbi:hypothetical protein P879_03326 [Paragonimus westermani]|uniref:Uncharacterized protein n=1 Tax=Paragonimus westermani TaxID=34504 RepID=A0A8T0DPB4_9TREM|nr:hypothetical protein P879_03326 [Paragonimus westermani]
MGNSENEEASKTAVLTDISLLNLAKALKGNDVRPYLLLNLPLTVIVKYYEEMRRLNQRETAFKQRAIMRWKAMRETKKDKEKVSDLNFALRESEHKELADILIERNRMNLEITRDLLQG